MRSEFASLRGWVRDRICGCVSVTSDVCAKKKKNPLTIISVSPWSPGPTKGNAARANPTTGCCIHATVSCAHQPLFLFSLSVSPLLLSSPLLNPTSRWPHPLLCSTACKAATVQSTCPAPDSPLPPLPFPPPHATAADKLDPPAGGRRRWRRRGWCPSRGHTSRATTTSTRCPRSPTPPRPSPTASAPSPRPSPSPPPPPSRQVLISPFPPLDLARDTACWLLRCRRSRRRAGSPPPLISRGVLGVGICWRFAWVVSLVSSVYSLTSWLLVVCLEFDTAFRDGAA